MSNQLYRKVKKGYVIIVFLGVLIAGFFLRAYQYDSWLYFKMDQSRDANLISHAIKDGPMLLPLLGPRAGATDVDNGFLRLGPAFYYFQYISGKIFNSTDPAVFAYPDLFFSMMAIVLLYFLARIYFSRNISLLVMAMYAFSFIVIQYSRFAWNPNSLQFFTLLTFFGLLKFLNAEMTKARIGWLAVWALALAIGSQLHFFGFFVLLGASGLLIVIRSRFWEVAELKKYFQANFLKKLAIYVSVFGIIFVFIYTPVILSDVMKKGENAKNFVQALSSKPSDKPFLNKIEKNVTENVKYYCLITTSFCGEGKVKDNSLPAAATILLVLAGLFLAVRAIRKEPTGARRDFLTLLFIWVGVFFILTIPVSFDLRPRFFILVFAVPFILAGVIFDFLQEKVGKNSIYFISIVAVVIVGSNTYGVSQWFREQSQSQVEFTNIDRTLILKNKDGVTLGQLQGVADYIYGRRKESQNVYFYVKPEHVQPMRYLFEEKDDSSFRFFTMSINSDPNAQYFAVVPADAGLEPVSSKFDANFTEVSSAQFGQLKVYEIHFTEREMSDNFRFNKKKDSTDRLFWKDVFGLKGITIEADMNE